MNLRLYTFSLYQLSSIQQTIQGGHASHELFCKYYANGNLEEEILYEWANNHKTWIALNGGAWQQLQEKLNFIESAKDVLRLPYAPFHEDEFSLNRLMTAFAIIVPEKYYAAVDYKTAINTYPEPKKFLEDWPTHLCNNDLFYIDESGGVTAYQDGTEVATFIRMLQSCPLAR